MQEYNGSAIEQLGYNTFMDIFDISFQLFSTLSNKMN